MPEPLLRIEALDAFYGDVQALRGVTLEAHAGEILCVLGRNGAGKSTLMRAIMGLMPRTTGRITFQGTDLTGLPAHAVPTHGIGYVPQGRRLFAELTVAENLEIGLGTRGRGASTRDRLLAMFPVLQDRLGQRAGTLSGGEQQQLAMARALAVEPALILLDEPTEGLQPSMIALVRDTAKQLRGTGTAVILVEQRVAAVKALADRVTFLENGSTRETLTAAEIPAHDALFDRYAGVSG